MRGLHVTKDCTNCATVQWCSRQISVVENAVQLTQSTALSEFVTLLRIVFVSFHLIHSHCNSYCVLKQNLNSYVCNNLLLQIILYHFVWNYIYYMLIEMSLTVIGHFC